MKKEFWHYMENAQENKKLEVQNEAIGPELLMFLLAMAPVVTSGIASEIIDRTPTDNDKWENMMKIYNNLKKQKKEPLENIIKTLNNTWSITNLNGDLNSELTLQDVKNYIALLEKKLKSSTIDAKKKKSIEEDIETINKNLKLLTPSFFTRLKETLINKKSPDPK